MKKYHDSNPNCINLHASKQGPHATEAGALLPVFEKSDAERKNLNPT